MTTTATMTNAQLVAHYGAELFGAEWVADMGRLTDVNARTMSRIKAAAAAGEDYPAARGVLAALREALDYYAAEVRQFAPPES